MSTAQGQCALGSILKHLMPLRLTLQRQEGGVYKVQELGREKEFLFLKIERIVV